jgi:lipopolysaccharide/colanic/teichoic acid biosynthesis glycosyltransferase
MAKMRSATKGSLDLVTSALALILLSLPFAAIALAIKLDDCSPVFFRQVRIGRGGKPFRVWKFRAMSVMEVSPKAPDLLSRDDPRITRVGQRLRNLGLDELPQLLNVLAGEMSLVGLRPALAYQVERYDAFQHRRLEVRPGITSLAAVSGRNAISWEERIALDVWYVDHWSLGLDLRILAKTLWCVLITRKGLYGRDGMNDTFVGPRDP